MSNLGSAHFTGEPALPNYREYPASGPLLIGFDPESELPADHLARLVDQIVDESIGAPASTGTAGQPAYDPRLCLKFMATRPVLALPGSLSVFAGRVCRTSF